MLKTCYDAAWGGGCTQTHIKPLVWICHFLLLEFLYSTWRPSSSPCCLPHFYLYLAHAQTQQWQITSFHLCLCVFGWFQLVMGLGSLRSSHCCNVHVLQISSSSDALMQAANAEDTTRGCSSYREFLTSLFLAFLFRHLLPSQQTSESTVQSSQNHPHWSQHKGAQGR